MKVLTIVGARPQFIKAAMVSRAIVMHNSESLNSHIVEEIVHTGQHYDDNMSDVFFQEMNIPSPCVQLDFGGKSHGAMTGQMLEAIEKEIVKRKPDWLLVYGDTNSTLAGALAAAKQHVPIAHVEAGLRSYNKKMPEEINRILTDHVSTLLFCPTKTAIENLKKENLVNGVHLVGDVMYDSMLLFGEIAEKRSTIFREQSLRPKSYYLATVHRQENTDDPKRLEEIFKAFNIIATKDHPVVVPLHPRTRLVLCEGSQIQTSQDVTDEGNQRLYTANSHVHLVSPVSFFDMIMLEKNARIILTDSGGVQKEAYWHSVPCITLRDETEWIETIETGWNHIVGANASNIIRVVEQIEEGAVPLNNQILYGEGNAAYSVCKALVDNWIQ